MGENSVKSEVWFVDPHGSYEADAAPVITCLADVEPVARTAVETAYRRGFNQGVAACIEAMERGHKLSALKAWLNRLYRWRCERHRGVEKHPEWLGRRD